MMVRIQPHADMVMVYRVDTAQVTKTLYNIICQITWYKLVAEKVAVNSSGGTPLRFLQCAKLQRNAPSFVQGYVHLHPIFTPDRNQKDRQY